MKTQKEMEIEILQRYIDILEKQGVDKSKMEEIKKLNKLRSSTPEDFL